LGEEKDFGKYIKQPDGSYICRKCGGKIQRAVVSHPIWDSPLPLSGSGRCLTEEVLYCPNCEEKPNSFGGPISPKGSYHNP